MSGVTTKVAVTVRSCDMSRTHWPVPVQPPLHRENVDPTLGVATSHTAALLGYAPAHVPLTDPVVTEQEIGGDASGVVTVPEPAPFPCTRSTWCVTVGVPVGVPPSLSPTQPAGTRTIADTAAARAHQHGRPVSTDMRTRSLPRNERPRWLAGCYAAPLPP
jgi:hypothetical protein